jgi:Galactose oxidase, central domain
MTISRFVNPSSLYNLCCIRVLPAFTALLLGCSNGVTNQPKNPIVQIAAPWVQITSPGPGPRFEQMAVLDSKRHEIVMFGGAGLPFEIWIFSLDSRTWHHINAANGPSTLSSTHAIADAPHDRAIIVGGSPGSGAINTVWSFSFATQVWSQLPTGPSPRFDIDADTDGKHGWFFGGFLPGFIAVNDLWQLDLSGNTWIQLPNGQTAPSPRTNAALGFFGDFLYLTGGHDQNGLTAGTWRYDLTTQSWTQLTPTGIPGAGAHFGYDVDSKCGALIVAFGDHDDAIDVSTTDLLSLSDSPGFFRLTTSALPPPRRHAPLVFDPQTRTLFTMGGLQGTDTALGDTWMYQLGDCSM